MVVSSLGYNKKLIVLNAAPLVSASSPPPCARCTLHRPLSLLYLNQKEDFWYELPGTLRGLTGGDRRLYLPSGVMNQVYDTKNRVVKA